MDRACNKKLEIFKNKVLSKFMYIGLLKSNDHDFC